MKRNLLKQMATEWRDNIWLILGLAIVTIAIWVLGLNMWFQIFGYLEPRGFEPTDVFCGTLSSVDKESPEYTDYGEEETALLLRDRTELLRRLRQSPYVEAVGVGRNALPYTMNYWGTKLDFADIPGDSTAMHGNMRTMTAQMATALRLNSVEGKSVEELTAILAKGEIIIGTPLPRFGDKPAEVLKQHPVRVTGDSINSFRVGAVVEIMKRSDYEPSSWRGMFIIPADEATHPELSDIAIRVKPGCAEKFKEEFRNTPEMRRHVNTYISGLIPLTEMGRSVNNSSAIKIRSTILIMSVVLLIVIIGLSGTFWFRVQQRTKEIAIRKVCGATSSDISRRVISEGLLLVVIASLLAAAIGWPLLRTLGVSEYTENSVVICFEAVTMVVLTIGIALSVWFPARRAMSIEPAIAIKDE